MIFLAAKFSRCDSFLVKKTVRRHKVRSVNYHSRCTNSTFRRFNSCHSIAYTQAPIPSDSQIVRKIQKMRKAVDVNCRWGKAGGWGRSRGETAVVADVVCVTSKPLWMCEFASFSINRTRQNNRTPASVYEVGADLTTSTRPAWRYGSRGVGRASDLHVGHSSMILSNELQTGTWIIAWFSVPKPGPITQPLSIRRRKNYWARIPPDTVLASNQSITCDF